MHPSVLWVTWPLIKWRPCRRNGTTTLGLPFVSRYRLNGTFLTKSRNFSNLINRRVVCRAVLIQCFWSVFLFHATWTYLKIVVTNTKRWGNSTWAILLFLCYGVSICLGRASGSPWFQALQSCQSRGSLERMKTILEQELTFQSHSGQNDHIWRVKEYLRHFCAILDTKI